MNRLKAKSKSGLVKVDHKILFCICVKDNLFNGDW